jgi:hypothetical protein
MIHPCALRESDFNVGEGTSYDTPKRTPPPRKLAINNLRVTACAPWETPYLQNEAYMPLADTTQSITIGSADAAAQETEPSDLRL